MESPFEVEVHNKALHRVGWVNDPVEIVATPRHNNVGTCALTVASTHRRVPLLIAPGARLVVNYLGSRLMSGYITNREGSFAPGGVMTVTMQDDLWLLQRLLGWAVPGAAINAQGVKQDTRTGPAETVIKGFVSANMAHNTVDPITVAATQGRGSTVTLSSRMKQLAELVLTAADGAGIGLSAAQSGTQILFDAYTPRVYPHTLSIEAGTILSADWSSADSASTRMIAGGPNEGTSREFGQVINSSLEATYGYTNEGFVDAQSAESSSDRDEQGQKALDAAGPTSGFKLELSELKTFRYGGTDGVRVGDRVTVQVGGNTLTDVLREATLTFNSTDGPTVSPSLGERTDDPDRMLAKTLAAAVAAIRDLRAR